MRTLLACVLLLPVVWLCPAVAEKHCFTSFSDRAPPELLSQTEHWVNSEEGLTLKGLVGRPVWLQFNFWENCTPLRRHLVRWNEKYAKQGLVIIEIDGGRHERLEVVRACVAEKGPKHFVLWDEENRNHERYGVQAWPTAWLVGVDGRVIWEGNPARVIRRPERLASLEELIETQLEACVLEAVLEPSEQQQDAVSDGD